jgi:Patatin-like phospholipase
MAAPGNEPPLPLIALACQGGGSHAAFGAGVIHRLLEDHDQRFRLHALSGTSGGAVNALLVWSGLIQGGPGDGFAEAQRRLQGMWQDLGAASIPYMIRNWWGQFILDLPFTLEVSPYVWDLGAREEMIARLRKWAHLEGLPQDPERLNPAGHDLGAARADPGAAEGEQATRGVTAEPRCQGGWPAALVDQRRSEGCGSP